MNKILLLVGACSAVAAAGAIQTYAHFTLQKPLDRLVASSPSPIGASVSYRWWLPGSTIVFDVDRLGPGATSDAAFRLFLEYAATQSEAGHQRVYLARAGEGRFYLSGTHFTEIAASYAPEKFDQLCRAFPQYLKKPDGQAAFLVWSGSSLGVENKQRADYAAFTHQWLHAEE